MLAVQWRSMTVDVSIVRWDHGSSSKKEENKEWREWYVSLEARPFLRGFQEGPSYRPDLATNNGSMKFRFNDEISPIDRCGWLRTLCCGCDHQASVQRLPRRCEWSIFEWICFAVWIPSIWPTICSEGQAYLPSNFHLVVYRSVQELSTHCQLIILAISFPTTFLLLKIIISLIWWYIPNYDNYMKTIEDEKEIPSSLKQNKIILDILAYDPKTSLNISTVCLFFWEKECLDVLWTRLLLFWLLYLSPSGLRFVFIEAKPLYLHWW